MKGRNTRYNWETLSDEELLDLRFCDLELDLRGSPLERPIEKVSRELKSRGLDFRPHFWFSAEWFTPDGIPGIAVPFYLAHPRLMALDRKMMKGTLSETPELCLRILRHEAGHAVENAYGLRRLASVREVFGDSQKTYPRYYDPRPYSRRFVRNLGRGYAQSHPDEDFAETFAVWLTPKSQWRRAYAGWPALEKLRFMDALMREAAESGPVLNNTRSVEPLWSMKTRLRTHYRRQRRHFLLEVPEADRRLKAIFPPSGAARTTMTADAFLRKIKPKLSRKVSELSGEPMHRVERVLKDMILRSRALNLRVSPRQLPTHDGVPAALTQHTIRFLRAGLYRIAV